MTSDPHDADLPEGAEAAELRELYRRLEPPVQGEGLEGADPVTVHTVEWMRAAWTGVEAPALPAVPVRRTRRWPLRLVRLSVAAAVLAVAGAALFWRGGDPAPEHPPRITVAEGPGASPALSDPDPVPVPAPEPAAVQVLATRPDQFELRSGPVRLVLLDPPTATDEVPPGS